MSDQKMDRRTAIKQTLSTGLAAGAVARFPSFILPALAQGEVLDFGDDQGFLSDMRQRFGNF